MFRSSARAVTTECRLLIQAAIAIISLLLCRYVGDPAHFKGFHPLWLGYHNHSYLNWALTRVMPLWVTQCRKELSIRGNTTIATIILGSAISLTRVTPLWVTQCRKGLSIRRKHHNCNHHSVFSNILQSQLLATWLFPSLYYRTITSRKTYQSGHQKIPPLTW